LAAESAKDAENSTYECGMRNAECGVGSNGKRQRQGGSRLPARLEGGQRRKDRKEKHLGFRVVAALTALRPACRSLDPPVESLWVEREALDGQIGPTEAPVGK